MSRKLVAILGIVLWGTGLKADVLDLSSSDIWADKTAVLNLTTANATYTALNDFTYSGRLYLLANNITLDLTEETSGSPARTISPTSSSYAILLYNASAARSRCFLKGGIWDFGQVGVFDIGNGNTRNGTLVLTNACVCKNVKGFYFQGAENGTNELIIAGQSQLLLSAGTGDAAANVLFQMGDVSTNNQHDTLSIVEGSTVSVDGGFLVEAGTVSDTSMWGNHTVFVSGSGSSLSVLPSCTDKTKRYFSTGRSRGNHVIFTDHAMGRFQHTVYHGQNAYAGDNLFLVEENAAVTVEGSGTLVVGDGTTKNEGRNTLLVRSGGSFTCSSACIGGQSTSKGRFAEVIVSNATFACTTLQLGQGPSNRLEVCGSEAHFNFATDATSATGIFTSGGYNELVLRDYAVWSPTRKVRFCCDYGFSSNNVVSVTDGAEIRASQDFMIGGNDSNVAGQSGWCHSNMLVVARGGSVSTDGSLLFYSNDNALIVSNATVKAAAFSMYNAQRSIITLAGETPSIQVSGNLPMTRSGKLHFVIPDAGYAASFVPLTAGSLTFNDTTELRVSLSDAFLRSIPVHRSIPLAVADTLTIDDAVLADANANLPAKCKLAVVARSDGRKALQLSVPGCGGLILMIR